MKYLLLIVLLVAVILSAGCVVQNNNPPVPPTPQIVYVTVLVTPTQAAIVPTPMVTTTIPLTITSTIQTLNTAQIVGNSVPGKVTVYFFYGEECPHCHNVIPFIQNLSKKYPNVDFLMLETWHNETNNVLFNSLNQRLAIQNSGVPEVIVIGNNTPLVGDRDIPAYLEGVILEQLKNGSEQLTANIQMIGSVYGLASNPSSGIDEIRFTIGLAPGAQPIDLTKMKIVFSTTSISPIILTQGGTASNTVFTTKLSGATNVRLTGEELPAVNSMNANSRIGIAFKTDPIKANTKMNIELRPAIGAALPFSKTTPATISATNLLY